MKKLTSKQFDKLSREHFTEVLGPYGFCCKQSNYCTFYRKVSEDIFHFIMPDKSRRHPQYDIKVFPHSPKLDSDFDTKFPDSLAVTTDSFGYLHSKTGVGPDQEWYWCRTSEGFIRNFEEKVKPALINYAILFLERINSIQDMQRTILRGPFVARIEAYLNDA